MAILLLFRHATRPFASLSRLGGSDLSGREAELLAAESRVRDLAERLKTPLYDAAGAPSPEAGSVRRRAAILAIRRDVHNGRAPRAGDVDHAAPALPPAVLEDLSRFAAALASLRDAEDAWSREFASRAEATQRALVDAVRDPLVDAGLNLAGRALAAKVRALARREPSAWSHGERHVAAKAAAYLARFATKTSPHSVFCATSIAWADGEQVSLEGRAGDLRTDVILSVAEARKIACVLAATPEVAAAIVPRPNPTLRDDDGGLAFWRLATLRRESDDETLTRVKDHPVLRIVLEEARGVSLPELIARVASRSGASVEAVEDFLRRLVDTGVLLAEIEIPYNERRPLRFVATRALEAGCRTDWAAPVLDLESEIDRAAGLPWEGGERDDAIRRALDRLHALPHVRPLRDDELLRVDAASGLEARLPGSVVSDLLAGLGPYVRFFAAVYPARRYRQGWIDRFLARFPADVAIPMLDVYRFITEQADSYRPAAFPEPDRGRPGAEASLRALAAVRDHIAAAARERPDGGEVVLDDALLERLVPDAPRPRWACGVLFQIAARDPDTIRAGRHRLVLNGLFHGAGLSLSRFAYLLGGASADDSNPVVRELRRAWSVIERPGAIVAELTYNHLGRTANAGLRPSIFPWEIELPGDCSSPRATRLTLRDLHVRWAGDDDRFVLTRDDGTEVIPVINSGVNPVGFVSFLVAIGEQTLDPIGYIPGFDLPGITRWPRVSCGALTLFREKWIFRAGEWPAPPARGDDPVPFARAALAWRARWRLPRHVFVHTSRDPKPRYVDLEAPLFLDLFRRELLGLPDDATLHVTEMSPAPDELWAGGHASEFLVQLSG